MAEAAERAAHIASKRADIGALAAFGAEVGAMLVDDAEEGEPVNFDRTRFEVDGRAVAGEIVSTLAVDFHRGKAGRYLFDAAGEARDERGDLGFRGSAVGGGRRRAVGVVGVALVAPAHREPVNF